MSATGTASRQPPSYPSGTVVSGSIRGTASRHQGVVTGPRTSSVPHRTVTPQPASWPASRLSSPYVVADQRITASRGSAR